MTKIAKGEVWGEVWLVGAGPGDPDLLTRKAERLIGAASVVFHDALVGPGVLDLIPADVRRVSVGKRAGRHSKDQKTIDQLIVEAALAGERVVRLKGGDPSIFGRSMEELTACREAGISVRICPGITAASAASASLGTSLTLRGLARRLTFVTAHTKKGQLLALDWQALADPQATLAIYMGKSSAPEIAKGLMEAGMAGDTPVAMVENASLPEEKIFRTRLDLLPLGAKTALGSGPALLLIGCIAERNEEVALHEAKAELARTLAQQEPEA
ncbi:uroporphyrinogen-III C-methyltransferase [Alteraurantiacibacter aquimixticola]|uniref:uroporphyrinogen-III C-methyltransferase n=1 Tax=Alteraurantiacibacter aquimixticola TaxID=2489173 RepID=A0A4T3F1Y1_9SPHN|nr:uroporphyrinogen-III C-methyltransferase [Alteraurantiacibacter aquimixticola]TIX51233.1 uroporphyrinogen-III C-methyltransferase [Alteraurantiacibacter aquimixticola]